MTRDSSPNDPRVAEADAQAFRDAFRRMTDEVHRVVVGQSDAVEGVITALVCQGHALLEGVPGLGKTLLVRTLARSLELEFSRIQFTPDLMPADILGTMVLHEVEGGGHDLRFEQGPLIANFVLADEINRATPKTQSAMLEAMQERTVTVSRRTLRLPEPFVVLATQNPIEQEGTYPLPEAQLDRFLMKLVVDYPSEGDYKDILERTTGEFEPTVHSVATGQEILNLRRTVRRVVVSEQVRTYAVRVVMGTQPGSDYATEAVRRYVALGSSPRGAQGLLLVGKVKALLAGRFAVACEDIVQAACPVLRHRLILNFEGQSRGQSSDGLIAGVLEETRKSSKV